jgi:hypothetical protein
MLSLFSDFLKHVYKNQIIAKWKKEEIKGNKISGNGDIKKLLKIKSYSGGFRRCTTNFYTKFGDTDFQKWITNVNKQSESDGF